MIEQQVEYFVGRDDTRIAYACTGNGQPVVKTANWLTHIGYDQHNPIWRHWLAFLSASNLLIRYDERGNGLSDRLVDDVSFERWVEDLEMLVDNIDVDRFTLLGISQGGSVALEYAARYPEKVERIVLCGAYAVGWAKREDASELRRGQALLELIESGWGEDIPAYRQLFANLFAPDARPEHIETFSELQRKSTDPATASRLIRAAGDIDIRDRLAKVSAPTLVMHADRDARVPFSQGRLLASSIRGAKLVPLPSRNHALLENERAWRMFKAEYNRFMRQDRQPVTEPLFSELTPREAAVATAVAAGLSNAEVGASLNISEKTVRNNLTSIFSKLGVASRAQLIVLSHQSQPQ